jgi:hypothetical protein
MHHHKDKYKPVPVSAGNRRRAWQPMIAVVAAAVVVARLQPPPLQPQAAVVPPLRPVTVGVGVRPRKFFCGILKEI